MITLKTILVAMDFSECSQTALKYARSLAGTFGSSIHVLHVVNEPLHEQSACCAPGAAFLDLVEQLEAEARTRLGTLVTPDKSSVGPTSCRRRGATQATRSCNTRGTTTST